MEDLIGPGNDHQLRRGAVRAAARDPLAGLPARGRPVPRTEPAAPAGPGAGGPSGAHDVRRSGRCSGGCRTGTPTAAAFEPGPLPGDLLERLRDDAAAEGATLAVIDGGPAYQRLTAILGGWSRWRDLYPSPPPRYGREPRRCGGPARRTATPGTACRRMPSRPWPRCEPGGCRSATSTWAGAGASRRPAVRPPRSRRSWCTRRGRAELAAHRPGPAADTAARRQPVGVRRPVDAAAAIRVGPGADPRQPDADRVAAAPAGAGRGPYRSSHGPPPASEVTTER